MKAPGDWSGPKGKLGGGCSVSQGSSHVGCGTSQSSTGAESSVEAIRLSLREMSALLVVELAAQVAREHGETERNGLPTRRTMKFRWARKQTGLRPVGGGGRGRMDARRELCRGSMPQALCRDCTKYAYRFGFRAAAGLGSGGLHLFFCGLGRNIENVMIIE